MSIFKKGICIDCPEGQGQKYIYAKGRCERHYWEHLEKEGRKKDRIIKVSGVSAPILPTPANENITTLRVWYEYHIYYSSQVCENCGEKMIYPDLNTAISCQAHILSKGTFPSVKLNMLNHLTLGGLNQNCNCHGQFDSSWLNASKMPVWPLALKRFALFRHHVLEPIPEFFSLIKI